MTKTGLSHHIDGVSVAEGGTLLGTEKTSKAVLSAGIDYEIVDVSRAGMYLESLQA